jgi:hypothetical protein
MAPMNDPVNDPSPKRIYLQVADLGYSQSELREQIIFLLEHEAGIQADLRNNMCIWTSLTERGWLIDTKCLPGFVASHICAIDRLSDTSPFVFVRLYKLQSPVRTLYVHDLEHGANVDINALGLEIEQVLAKERGLQDMLTDSPRVWLEVYPSHIGYRDVPPPESVETLRLPIQRCSTISSRSVSHL